MDADSGDEKPAIAPEIERRLHLTRAQWIGLPLFAMVPLLAILGVFDEARNVEGVSDARIELQVDYPLRLRYHDQSYLEIRLRNLTSEPLETVYVRLPHSYTRAVEILYWAPPPGDANTVILRSVAAGEERTARLYLRATRYGRFDGIIDASSGAAVAETRVHTLILP